MDQLDLIQYHPGEALQYTCELGSELPILNSEQWVSWINLELSQQKSIQWLADQLKLHHLMVEDIYNTKHQPKFESEAGYLFLILNMLRLGPEGKVQVEHVSLLLTRQVVISFQEDIDGDVFGELRDRILRGRGRVRQMPADYLFYLLVDVIVDHYLIILEALRERIFRLEEEALLEPGPDYVTEVYRIRKELNRLRRFALPLRDEVGRLKAHPSDLLHEGTQAYWQDVYDHLVFLSTSYDSSREMVLRLLELHQAYLAQENNQVMKTLTIVATIFIPLTFIAGLYGMNFQHMPELAWPWAYPAVIGLLVAVPGAMLWSMWRKGGFWDEGGFRC